MEGSDRGLIQGYIQSTAYRTEDIRSVGRGLYPGLPKYNPFKIQPLATLTLGRGLSSLDGEHGSSPTKPRCEASCRGLHGTGVVTAVFPRGTGQHPVVSMLSIRKGLALRVVTFSSVSLGTSMEQRNKAETAEAL